MEEAAVRNLSSSFGIEISSGSCANVGVSTLNWSGGSRVYNTFVFGTEESKDSLKML